MAGLLFDENLSEAVVNAVSDLFPNSTHLRSLGLGGNSDLQVWETAKRLGLVLVTRDYDFQTLSVVIRCEFSEDRIVQISESSAESTGSSTVRRVHFRSMMGRLSILLSLALVVGTRIGSYAGDEWDEADQKVVRLAPRAFSQLPECIPERTLEVVPEGVSVRPAPECRTAPTRIPEGIVAYLEKRRCLVPQPYNDGDGYDAGAPQNVARGEFSVAGQTDLAVLCSIDRVSTILVFWKMSTDSVAEVAQIGESAQFPDRDQLVVLGGGKIGFSLRLTRAGPGGCSFPDPDQPPPVAEDHDGIEVADINKFVSAIWYFHNGTWLRRVCGGC